MNYSKRQKIESQYGDFTDYNVNREYQCSSDIKSKGFTPLMYLIITKQFNVITQNINELKIIINDTSQNGWTALMIACRNSRKLNCLHIIKLLLDYGANVDHESNDNWTALLNSAGFSNTDSNIETVKLLLNYNININYETKDGWTALILSANSSNTYSNIETVKLLLDHRANINYETKDGATALQMSVRNSNGEINIGTVKLLLDCGANINYETKDRMTALILSARNSNKESNIETVKLLLDRGANVNYMSDGWTPLLSSARNSDEESNIETVELLLNYGADPYIKNINGYDTFMMTEYNKKLIPILDQWKFRKTYFTSVLVELKYHYMRWMYHEDSPRTKLLCYKSKKYDCSNKKINDIFGIGNQEQLNVRIRELDIINTEKLTLYRKFRK